MIFDIYKRFEVEILRKDDRWVVYRNNNGTKRPDWTIIIPHELREDELAGFLDDFFHEYAGPGDSIIRK